MKKISLIFLVVLIPFLLKAQISFDLNGTVNKRISFILANNPLTIGEGTSVTLKSIHNIKGFDEIQIFDNDKNMLFSTSMNNLSNVTFKPINIKQFWQKQALNHDVYENISKKGIQYELRKELEEDAIDYISYAENNNLIFKDSYLESYLYALAYKIYPVRIEDERPGILNVKILKSTAPNAFIFPNGTMFLSTGILSTINSDEELIGVMAHEISHFVLDHSIININKGEQRMKRANFWAAFATVVAATADIYAAANNENYSPGALTIGTGILAFSISSAVIERLGLEYSREQEMEADKCASALLKFINIDSTALSSALLKIKNFNIMTGNYSLSLSGKGTHPGIDDRIQSIGKPTSEFFNPDYDKTISFVNSFNAIAQLNNHQLQSCSDLLNRNIKADIATETDYILLAKVTTFMYDNKEKNNEALSYINKAKTLDIYPSIYIHKQEAIILIRLGKYDDAKIVLNKYLSSLESEKAKYKYSNNFIFNEKEWTVKMINKVNKM